MKDECPGRQVAKWSGARYRRQLTPSGLGTTVRQAPFTRSDHSAAAIRPGVTAAVIGPRRAAHIDDALRALETPLSDGQLARLEALFPPIGRGGPTPDAWIS